MKTIFEFKKGDKITRIKPANGFGDRSYMGDELVLIGIANGQIYFKNNNRFMSNMLGEDHILNVALDLWSEGWIEYIDPKTLLEGQEDVISNLSIEKQIERAVENEDYELAEKLKRKLG